MKISSIDVHNFRRFTKLQVGPLKPNAKLVVVVGPNGSGKTALFDAINTWYRTRSGHGRPHDPLYFEKVHPLSSGPHILYPDLPIEVTIHGETWEQHQQLPTGLVHVRSAQRQDADFTVQSVSAVNTDGRGSSIARLIDIDQSVAANYQMLVGQSVEGLFSESRGEVTLSTFRTELTGPIKKAFTEVFPDLELSGLGNPLQNGSFYFSKGTSRNFHYKNLSAGEKSVFDLLLDLTIGARLNKETIYLIDEPEIHTNAKIQRSVLEQMMTIVPDEGQLWIATHSFGMMNAARSMREKDPDSVIFLNFFDRNFDQATSLTPEIPSRSLWQSMLTEVLDDVADLVAPTVVVFCEGGSKNSFDAQCFDKIFARQFPDATFVGIDGGSNSIERGDHLNSIVLKLSKATKVIRLVDKDDRNPDEVETLKASGTNVLNRREIENYLLDEEVVTKFVLFEGVETHLEEVLQLLRISIANARARKPNAGSDEVKDAAGDFFVGLKSLIDLTGRASNYKVFLRDVLAPHVAEGTTSYEELRNSIFDC